MSNKGNVVVNKMATPANSNQAAIMWRGYCDARNGLPFTADYDGWHESAQRNYEWGRGLATYAKAKLGSAPNWPRNRHITRMLPPQITSVEWLHHKEMHHA